MKNSINFLILFITFQNLISQTSGSGTLEWWQATCAGVTCNRQIDNEDIYTIVATDYGDLSITGNVGALTGHCNGCDYPSAPIKGNVFSNCISNVGNFGTTPTTIIIECMAPGDTVCIKFITIGSAFYGDYSFTSTFIPEGPQGNENEPNNTMETAQSLPIPYPTIEGHLYYGLGGINLVDGIDYFEIGFFQIGDNIQLTYSPIVSTGSCQLFRLNHVGSLLTLIPANPTGSFTVTDPDIYYIKVSNTGNAPCTPYTVSIAGDTGSREYNVLSDQIEIDHDPDENTVYIYGNFQDKTLEIINASNTLVEDLTGMNSPIVFDVTSLPAGKHFLVVKDNGNALLQIQDLIKE